MGSNSRRVLIIAHSGRVLAEAAISSGWSPWVIDQFADVDTRLAAERVVQVSTAGGGFDESELLFVLSELVTLTGPIPLVFGGGFESDPELVAEIERYSPIYGCSLSVLRGLVDRPAVFEQLRHSSSFTFPETQHDRPVQDFGWLCKRIGGAGGEHVRVVTTSVETRSDEYFQRYISGVSMSALLISDGSTVKICGLAEHLHWNPSDANLFRYEGAYRSTRFSLSLLKKAEALGAHVASAFGIVGCFGIDFITSCTEEIVLVDVNPRPTATLDLYPDKKEIFNAHMAVCAGAALLYSRSISTEECGHLVLYAEEAWEIPENIDWPGYVADRPVPGALVDRGAPLCTLRVVSKNGTSMLDALSDIYDKFHRFVSVYNNAILPGIIALQTMGSSPYDRT